MSDLRDLIDTDDLDPDEEARLRRIHELLLEAGPPAELPPGLARPGAPPTAQIVAFPLPRRRVAASLVAAAAVAAAAFGGGYLFGHARAKPETFAAAKTMTMRSTSASDASANAVLQMAHPDSAGNWPMEMTVRGLPRQSRRGAYYELWLTRDGKPAEPCGSFRVHGSSTTVDFSVPYNLKAFDGWIVTAVHPGGHEPGPVMLTT